MDCYRDAWEELYASQGRPWRGMADISWMGIQPGEKVLDLGCGNGKTSEALLNAGASVTGVDYSASAVESCVRRLGERAVFEVADVRDLPFADEAFDSVVSVHVLEHVPAYDIGKAAEEVLRVLRKGGRLYFICFAEGDMRSGGKKEDVRNGILYRYLSEGEVRSLFPDSDISDLVLLEEPTRFGTVRRRFRCVVTKR